MKSLKGAIFIVLGLVLLAAVVIWAMAGKAKGVAEGSAKAFIDQHVPEILKSWDAGRLLDLSADEMKQRATREEFDKMIEAAKTRFGNVEKYLGTSEPSLVVDGNVTVASSTASAKCERGTIYADIRLVSSGKGWQFARFFLTDKSQ